MISFSRILFPVDLSPQSRQAAPFVAAMATRFSSEVLVLHVVEPHLSYYPIPAAVTSAAIKSDQARWQARQDELESFVSSYLRGVSPASELAEGDAAERIVACARESRADLIMMPTHGYGKFRRLLLGSVTAKVLHDAECPVWTGVHADQMWSVPGAGWHRFLCAVDEDPGDVPLLKWAAQFACEQRADLRVVHAVHAGAPRHTGGESESLREFLLGVAKETLARMQTDAGTSFEIDFVFGPAGHVMHEAARECRADLILIGRGAIRKGFGRLRSSAYEVIRDAPCPVISV